MTETETLRTLWPPPATCVGHCTPDVWDEVEKQIGIRPPPDFQDLLTHYGSGYVGIQEDDPFWLVVRSPRNPPGYGNLVDAFRTATTLLAI